MMPIMKGSLRSTYDAQSYADYIAGTRKYFTIYGMEIDTDFYPRENVKDPSLCLINKCAREGKCVPTKCIREYIQMYGMETGIIHKGYIGYIKDSFLFASSMIINIYDFEKLDNPEKDVADTFINHGMWDYDKCQVKCSGATEYILYKRIAQLELVAKNAELVTKKMCETISKLEKKCDAQQEMLLLQKKDTDQITEKLEQMIRDTSRLMLSSIDKIETTNKKCFDDLYECVDNIEACDQYCQDREDEFTKEFYTVKFFTAIFIITTTMLLGTGVAYVSSWTRTEQSVTLDRIATYSF